MYKIDGFFNITEHFLFNSLKNINHEKRYIFIHIPRTGGTTVEKIFFKRLRQSEHLTIDSYKSYNNYFIFTFVRNPYLRIISLYTYFLGGGNGDKNEPKITCDINDLFENHNNEDIKFLNTQFSYLKNSNQISHICKFENFELEVSFLSNKFNKNISIPKLRENIYKNSILKPNFIDRISELYDIDFKTYNYKKIKLDQDISLFEFIELTKFNDELIYYKRSPRLNIWYLEAYNEIKKYNENKVDIAKFPYYWYKKINNLNHKKIYDFVFIGSFKIDYKVQFNRKWILKFIENNFNINSYLQFTDKNTINQYKEIGEFDYTLKNKGFVPKEKPLLFRRYFDETYYAKMCQSKFCLCPSGDSPWSMRFYEAIMCKTIPIVKSKIETYRSELESKIDYKYYLSDSPKFDYREDWVEHNYKIFLEYHTFDKYFK
tara:strand:- start:583 stop:1875 length:1293 start_codon:yes stop_codon:yes gene_type:complete